MYGLMSDLSLMWDLLVQWTSPMNLVGAALLAFLLVVHVVALNLVVRDPELPRLAASRREGEDHERANVTRELRSGGAALERSATGSARLARAGHAARF
jgi:hypothetical protein